MLQLRRKVIQLGWEPVVGGGAMEERCHLSRMCGMMSCHRSGHQSDRQIIKEKIRCGLKRPPNNANTHNNQPKTRGHDRGGIEHEERPWGDMRGAQCCRFGDNQAQMILKKKNSCDHKNFFLANLENIIKSFDSDLNQPRWMGERLHHGVGIFWDLDHS